MKFIIATRTSNKIILKKAGNCVKINLIVHSFPKNSFIYQIAMPKSDFQYFNCCWPMSNISFVEDIKSFEQCVYLQVLSD